MRFSTIISTLSALCVLISVQTADADEIATIGPLTGTSAIIGEDMARGLGSGTMLDSACNADKAENTATQALETGAQVIVGLPCIEALDAAIKVRDTLNSKSVIITLGVEVPDITKREKNETATVFRLGGTATQEAKTIANYIKSAWRGKNFAIVDDGTLYGRQLAETVRFALEEDNLKPVFTDNYRPLQEQQSGLVRRIAKSGATHVFIGGDAYDAAIIGRDAAELNIPFAMVGGAAFRAPADEGVLPNGTIFAAPKRIALKNDGNGLDHYAALTQVGNAIARQALTYAQENGVGVREAMSAAPFSTSIGEIRFSDNGENDRQWFSLYEVVNGQYTQLSRNN